MRFDLFFFEADDLTPFYGVGDEYELAEADFSTDPAHPRPYLAEVKNWSATEIDFAAGASTIGAVTVSVVDKRTDPGDQDTGILTARLSEVVGRRALLRRLVDGVMVTAFEGVVQSYSMGGGPEGLVLVSFSLRDAREREREQPLFFSNFVLFGRDGASGPGIDYGALPGGGFLLDAVEPQGSIAGGISHFQAYTSPEGISFGNAPLPANVFVNLQDRGLPTQDIDGIWYYRGVQVRWREKDSADPWVTLRNMPALSNTEVVYRPSNSLGSAGDYFNTPSLYFGSFDAADIPATGQEIEFQVLAVEITQDAPFFWDGGTFGDLLREIYDGDHSADPRPIPYSVAGMDAFAAATPAARFILTEPVENMREWVEQNIYQAVGYAPAFDEEQRVYPVPWALPENTADIPIIPVESIVPIGDWGHGEENVTNTVEYTYLREGVADQETTIQKGGRKFLLFGPRKSTEVEGTLSQWDRYFTKKVILPASVDIGSVATFGTKKLTIAPVTVRTIGDVDGRPSSGDVVDEAGAQIARRIGRSATLRFSGGAPVLAAEAIASGPTVKALKIGDWVRVRVPWFPDYATGRRGVRRYMQVRSISDESPIIRRLSLVDSGVPDPDTEGDAACLSGGTPSVTPGGLAALVYQANGDLVNACAHSVTVQVLLIAGGGGGGTGGADNTPGGGGAGGVLEAVDVLIAASVTIPVTVGTGGAFGGTSGGDTVLWAGPTGLPLVPGVDPPPANLRALGGGGGGNADGAGQGGGSGGGGGETLPISGGSNTPGGTGTAGQGFAGGDGNSAGGLATCQEAAGGGGGSYGGLGGSGNSGIAGGDGGPSTFLPAWGVTAGGGGSGPWLQAAGGSGGLCGTGFASGVGGAGVGAGGGGGSGGGVRGVLVVAFAGSAPAALATPTVTSTDVETDGRVTICVEDADWPPVAVDGYRVRVDYAIGALEPAPASGDWRLAGYLDSPGCVTTPPVPTGATVWRRATAEASAFLPSAPTTATDSPTPESPGLLALALTIAEDGTATVTWTANAFADTVEITGLIHDDAASVDRPLAAIDSVSASPGTYALPGVVPQREFYTIDLQAFLGAAPGTIYRLSRENPPGTDFPDTEGVPAGSLLGWDGSFPQWITTIEYANLPAVGGTWAFGAANALVLEGQLVTAASTTARAGLLLTVGAAPTGAGLVDGALWVTTSAIQARVNGATVTLGVTLPLAVTSGGTGLTTLAAGAIPYASVANVISALAIDATPGRFLRTTGSLPAWSTLVLPNTLAIGRVLVTTGTDVVGGVAPTSGRALVADGSSWAAGTLPFAALPTGASGSWTLGGGNTLTIANRTELSDGIKVSGAYGLGGTTPANPRTVTGSRGANAALASLLTQLAAHGVIVDSTTV